MKMKLLLPVVFLAGLGASYALAGTQARSPFVKTGTKPGKVAICHKTSSQSKPYVRLSVSERSLKAHRRHGDIIPAPAGGCPGAGATTAVATTAPVTVTAAVEQVTICHRTGSTTNPYVAITIAKSAQEAHRRHGDIVPAPAGGCPTTPASTVQKPGKGKGR